VFPPKPHFGSNEKHENWHRELNPLQVITTRKQCCRIVSRNA